VNALERQGQVFGKSTFKAVQQFQKRARLPLTGRLDEDTARALNRILRAKGLLPDEPLFKASGMVKNRSGEPVSGKTVYLFEVDFRGADLFRNADTVARLAGAAGIKQAGTARSGVQGEYEIWFDPQLSEGGLAGVAACVVEQAAISGRSSLVTNKELAEGVEIRGLDILLPKSSERAQSEFSLLVEKVNPLLASARLSLHQLNPDQVRLIAGETVYAGEYLWRERFMAPEAFEGSKAQNGYGLSDGTYLLTIALPSESSGLAGILRSGDTVDIYGYTDESGSAVVSEALTAVTVYKALNSKLVSLDDIDAGLAANSDADPIDYDLAPAYVVFIVDEQQAKVLIGLEKDESLHLTLRETGAQP
jgi:hypothetical protein